MRTSTIIGFLLVAAGGLYFLGELHIVHAGRLFSAGVLWPWILVLVGLYRLKSPRRKHFPLWSIFLILLGLALSVRNSGYVPSLSSVGTWSLLWSLLFVYLGLELLAPGRHRPIKVQIKMAGKHRDVRAEDPVETHDDGKWHSRSSKRWIGDISVGRNPWTLQDMDLWNGIGDVRVNLATAHVEDGTYHLKIGGWIGDVRVLVPPHLPVQVEAYIGLGDVTVYDEHSSGTGRRIHFEDPMFAASMKRVILHVDLKMGDVQVVRV